MKKQRIIWMTGGALIAVVLIVIVQQLMTSGTSAAPMTEGEAIQFINEQYPGSTPELIDESGSTFLFNLTNQNGEYELEIDRENKSVAYLNNVSMNEPAEDGQNASEELTEEEAIAVAGETSNGEVVSSTLLADEGNKRYEVVLEEENRILTIEVDAASGESRVTAEETKNTEEPARILSEQEAIDIALGTVSGEVDDVDLEQQDGVPYFLIEIETEEGDATVQINAISGEIMSTIWDD
ncbi:PepSY domain-containing protein [Jeotgalibacillus haloalkalitolerans]|uniref:PepSY domain-containing protein n=1 Tax=Jeotgalibacillus haloalkalitolerans TaxID=3104292 RepID=A0ABU5KPF4_9BACL|nr:PepSY domain-containing protein [Jeotgalibacillus sp. HH7-29]MDZ5712963.1 PepSY domain-containing protein [Jeotgalibacillus sp. HH7-29]